jgi:ribokinase
LTIVVLGNATVDLSYEIDHLPLVGETLLARNKFVDAGGKGLNQAIIAHRAGAPVRFCALIGDDDPAQVILRHLEHESLNPSHLLRHAGATDESLIFISPSGENIIVSTAEAARSLSPASARVALSGLVAGDLLIMQGNLARETTLAGLSDAHVAGVRTLLNPAPVHFDYAGIWPMVDIAVVNEIEAVQLSGTRDVDMAAKCLLTKGSSYVVVTLGAVGARLYDGQSIIAVPAPAVTPVDTTGAGDVVCGVLAAGLAEGLPMRAAVGWAVAAASLSVTRRGTSVGFPSRAELAELRAAILSTAGAGWVS